MAKIPTYKKDEETGAVIFQDSTANALAAGKYHVQSNVTFQEFHLTHDMVAGTTSATTFKLRAGKESAHAMALNGTITGGSPGRRLGGVSSSRIVVFEYVP